MSKILLSREELTDALVMDNDCISELVTTWEVPKDLIDLVMDSCLEACKEEPELAKQLTFYDKVNYMCDEAYKHGVLMALYMTNEVLKEGIAQLTKEKAQEEEATIPTKVKEAI